MRRLWRQNSPHYLPTRLLNRGGKTISIIGATMFNIVATRIIIVFGRIGVVVRKSEVKRFGSAFQTVVDSYFMGNAILR